jgi:peroxidase
MNMIINLCLIIIIISTINGQWSDVPQQQRQFFSSFGNNFQADNLSPVSFQPSFGIPFPQCLSTEAASALLTPSAILNIFQTKLQQENAKLKQERVRNDGLKNNDIMDFDALQLRSDTLNGALLARTATKVASEIMAQLGCITNSTITQQLDLFLRQIQMPQDSCSFNQNANCNGLTKYRTITGVCNNLQRPYEGSSQTAYARLLPAAYEDGLSKPRSQSVLGGPLPSCRQISLALGSKPVFDSSFNNLFVAYGQFLVHDITLATPVTDSGLTPITSCSCSTQDPDTCLVIRISADDPFMAGQQCIATPATAQAFTDQICSLGVKDQMNGNSHYIDLSVTYGSTKDTANGLRVHKDGLLKSTRRSWSKFELPPGQRDGKSCVDATETQRCFAAGDSRLMENTLLAGIQAQWLRLHNIFVRELASIRPDWQNNDDLLYEEAKKILSALHQQYTYDIWLPILIGTKAAQQYVEDNTLLTQYNPNLPGVVLNEAATVALRLHTFVRDLYSRCNRKGELIDQIWLNDIAAKCKLAYDAQNSGVDSLLCGSLFDFGFAHDGNFAQQIHHHLFETTNLQGETRRNDIVSINICRAREHGIPGYNAYRQLCGLKRAVQFQDFADIMSVENIQKLQMIYQHPDDVDLFVGVNYENQLGDGLVGPVSACIIGTQFQHLKYGDRFFYRHEGQFTPEQLNSIRKYSYSCFICHSTDIEKVALNPFRPPNDQTNPLQLCSQCPIFDFNPWRSNTRIFQ